MKIIIIIVYSFALRDREPNPCNVRLAKAAQRIRTKYEKQGKKVFVVAQKSAAMGLRSIGAKIDHTITHYHYQDTTDTEDITAQAIDKFRNSNFKIEKVIPVAHPIQVIKCRQVIQELGFQTFSLLSLIRKIGYIGFDRKSKQWWTRGLIRLLLGAARQILFGFNTRQNGPTELLEQ